MGIIEIRRPRIDDTNELKQFFKIVVTDTYAKEGIGHLSNEIDKEIEHKQKLLHSDFKSKGENRYFLIAKKNDQIVATIEFGPVSKLINDHSNGALKDIVEVGTAFVHPDFQRQGIGTLLLNVMFLTLQNKGIEEFCLDSGYKNAQKVWFKKLGEPDYVLKDYWSKGFDHMIWIRRVSDLAIMFKI